MRPSAHAFILLDVLVSIELQDLFAVELCILGRDGIVARGVTSLNRSSSPLLLRHSWDVAMSVGVGAHALILLDVLVGVVIQDHVLVELMVPLGGWTVARGVIMRHAGCFGWEKIQGCFG